MVWEQPPLLFPTVWGKPSHVARPHARGTTVFDRREAIASNKCSVRPAPSSPTKGADFCGGGCTICEAHALWKAGDEQGHGEQ